MGLKDQVVSLELAKKLKELGVKQDGLFRWQQNYHTSENYINGTKKVILSDSWGVFDNRRVYGSPEVVFEWWYKKVSEIEKNNYSAFTVAELGEILLNTKLCLKIHTYVDTSRAWWCNAPKQDKISDGLMFEADTEADARAKMLIYLLENDLIKI